jgi:ABC-type multidrug transport system ATPase subunit
MTSHQLDHVERVAARFVIMRRGGVVAQFSRAELAQLIPSRHASLTELYLECVGDSDADAEASTA